MYSKSQTVSPKSSGFLTALPSSISAPSLLLLQQPPQQSNHRKYNTIKYSSKEKSSQKKQQQQQQQIIQTQIQEQPQQITTCNNIQKNNAISNSKRENNNSGKSKFHKKINFLNKDKNNNISDGKNNNNNVKNNKNKSNINKSSIIITNDYIINDMGLTSPNNIINNLKSVSIHSDGKVEIDKSIKREVLATSNESLRTSIDKINSNNNKQPEIKDRVDNQSNSSTDSSKIDEEDEEIYPFSMNEDTLNEYFNFLSILSDYIDHQIATDDTSSISSNNSNNSNNSSKSSNIFSVFNVDQVPEISIYNYILRIFKYLPFGTDIFIFSIIYLDRVIQQNPEIQISYLNIHRLFMASVLVASKYHNDKSLNNRYYAQVGGVTLTEMNLLEINFLILIDWQLLINPDTFDSYNDLIQIKIKSLNSNKNSSGTISSGKINEDEQSNSYSDNISEQNNSFTDYNSDNNSDYDSDLIQDHTCNNNNNNSKIYQQTIQSPIPYQNTYHHHQYSPQYTTYPNQQNQQFYNNNNKFKRNISKSKINNPPRPNYLTYPIPSNQYHLYNQYYQQPPQVYSGSGVGSYDDNNIYYDQYSTGYTQIDQTSNNAPYMIDSTFQHYQQQQQQQQSWLNGSYYYHQQQSNNITNNHYHR